MSDYKHTPEQARKLWVEALRSGEYQQGEGFLCMPRNDDDESHNEFCCLGVACELFCLHEWPLVKHVGGEEGELRYDDHAGDLPIDVKLWLGLKDCEGDYSEDPDESGKSLVHLNDEGHKSFREIADIIESAPPGLLAEAQHA